MTTAETLTTPCIINHTTFIGIKQLKRVDSVDLNVEIDPRVRTTLKLTDGDRPLARLQGDTVNVDNAPVGAVRGWRSYVYADEAIEVVRSL